MSARQCAKTDKHKGRPIEAFCLQQDCKKNRLLCFYCIFQSHKNHDIAYLHKELDGPLSRLSIHADENMEGKDHFQQAFTGMIKYCDKLSKVVSGKVSSLRHHMQPQFEAIRKTFKKTSADDIIKDLTSNHHISQDREERYVKMLRFYSNKSFYDFNTLMENVNVMECKYEKAFEKATQKIEGVLKELSEEVLKFNLLKDQIETKDKMVPELSKSVMDQKLDRTVNIITSSIKGLEVQKERIQEEKEMHINDGEIQCEENEGNNEDKKSIDNIISEIMNAEVQAPSFSEMPHYSDREKMMMPEQEDIALEKIHGADGGKMIITKKNRGVAEVEASEQEASDNWDPPHKNFVAPTAPNQRQIRSQYLHQNQVEIINIYAPNTSEINTLLARIKPQTAKELSIYCSSQLCALDKESGRLISRFHGLKTLKVLWARGLPDDLVIYMVRHLPLLQSLCLAQFDSVTPKLVQALKINCLNLKTLFFTFDFSQNIFEMQSSLQFLPDIVNYKIPERLLQDLTMGLPELQNVELCGVRNLSYWVYCITESRQNLKQFSLFKYENQSRIDYTPLLEALSQCTHLETIKLQFVQFEQRNLVALFKNNPNLKTIIINECSMTKTLFDAIPKYCSNLKHLSVSLEDRFQGQSLGNLTNLQTLVIRGCMSIKPAILSHNLNKLKKLRCISFNFNNMDNNWVNDKILKTIGSMKRLTCLNLNHCKITAENISHISSLTHISTFVCDTNNFPYESILNLKSNLILRKLSIGKNMSNVTQQQIDLELIHNKFPRLTHLKLCSFKNIEVGKLALFEKLVSLYIHDGVEKEIAEIDHYCRIKNIKFITDQNEKLDQ